MTSFLPINTNDKVSEISISDVMAFLRKYYLPLMLTGLLFAISGYLISFLFSKTYKSSSVIIPELGTSSGLGSMSGLARLSGLASNSNNGALQSELYPSILQTKPFALHLLKQPVIDQNNKFHSSLEKFLMKDSTRTSFFSLFSPSKTTASHKARNIDKDILSLSRAEVINTRLVLSMITSTYEMKSGLITIEAEASDPVVAAELVDKSIKYLVNYVTNYRTEKAALEVTFLSKQVQSAQSRQQKAELALQSYRDRNRGAFLNVAKIEEQRLQSDFILAQTLYNDLIRKSEDAKIKLKEQQPIIKILSPAEVPYATNKPRRLIIALIFAISGDILLLIYLLIFKRVNTVKLKPE